MDGNDTPAAPARGPEIKPRAVASIAGTTQDADISESPTVKTSAAAMVLTPEEVERRKQEKLKAEGKAVAPGVVKISELAAAKLDALSWKQKALLLRAASAESAMQRKVRDARDAQDEIANYAKSQGIDIARNFDWDEKGNILYAEPKKG